MAWKYEIEHVEYSGSQGFYLDQLASVREISQALSYNIKKMLIVAQVTLVLSWHMLGDVLECCNL